MARPVRPASIPVAVLIAGFALAACDRVPDPPSKTTGPVVTTNAARAVDPPPLPKPPQAKYQRDLYGKMEDCVADWGLAPKCVPVSGDTAAGVQGAAVIGPIYSSALRTEAQMATRREAVDQGYVRQLDETPGNRAIATSEVRS